MGTIHDGTHGPLPDVLTDESDAAAEELPASTVPRLALVPQPEDPGREHPGRQRPVPRHEPRVPGVFEGRADSSVVVDAPSALTGFLLVMSLPRYRCRNAQGEDGRWQVSIELGDDDRPADLTEPVERWLRRERIAATDVRVGEHVQHLSGTTKDVRERAQ